jgi:hypothetical protein
MVRPRTIAVLRLFLIGFGKLEQIRNDKLVAGPLREPAILHCPLPIFFSFPDHAA